jgi:hypothetical protein
MKLRSLAIAVVCAGVTTGVTAAPAQAAGESWIVIASSPATDNWAWAIRRSKDDATQVAIGQCSKHGATDCQWVARSTNCAAYAKRDNGRGNGGTGPSLWDAEHDALLKNGGGWIEVSKCTQAGSAPSPSGPPVNFDDEP